MKPIKFAIPFFFLSISLLHGQSDPCYCDATSQAGVDTFAVMNPNCTELYYLSVSGNVQNLDGLSQITSVIGDISITSSPNNADGSDYPLVSIAGLNNITSVGGSIGIGQTPNLQGNVFSSLTFVGGNVQLYSQLPASLNGFNNLVSVGGSIIVSETSCQLMNLFPNLSSIGFALLMDGNAFLTSCNGFGSLTQVNAYISISSNPNLQALPNFSSFSNHFGPTVFFQVVHNHALTNLNGLSALQNVENLTISDNNGLASLSGLDGLQTIQTLNIIRNPQLLDLTPLGNLEFVNALYVYENDLLQDITGLQDVEYGQTVGFTQNPNLSNCSIESICNQLQTNYFSFTANNNAPNCNSAAEILAICNAAPPAINGGVLSATGSLIVCNGDGSPDFIQLSVTGNSGNSRFGMLNNTNDIIATNTSGHFNMENYPPGIYNFGHLSYGDSFQLQGLTNASQFQGDFDASNLISVISYPVDGGSISTVSPTNMCGNDGIPSTIDATVIGATGLNKRWVVLNSSFTTALAISSTPNFNFDNFGPGTYRLVHVSYGHGVNLSQIDPQNIQGCVDASNAITVQVVNCAVASVEVQPNPATSAATFNFKAVDASHTTLEIYDLTGRMIQRLFAGNTHPDGIYEFQYDVSHLPNGVYVYRAVTETGTYIEKFMVAR